MARKPPQVPALTPDGRTLACLDLPGGGRAQLADGRLYRRRELRWPHGHLAHRERMYDLARGYLRLGVRIVPVEPTGSKAPLVSFRRFYAHQPGAEPARLTAELVEHWWHPATGVYAGWNPAALTGLANRTLVLDADDVSALRWARATSSDAPLVRTSRGAHLYVAFPSTDALRALHRRVGREVVERYGRPWLGSHTLAHDPNGGDPDGHLDLKGDGGYCVAPGSVHASGRVYQFEGDETAARIWGPDADLPALDLDRLLELCFCKHGPGDRCARKRAWFPKPRPAPVAPPVNVATIGDRERYEQARRYVDAVPGRSSGEKPSRDDTCWTLAVALTRGFDLSDHDAAVVLGSWDRRNSPPLGERAITEKLPRARAHPGEPIGGRLRDPCQPWRPRVDPVDPASRDDGTGDRGRETAPGTLEADGAADDADPETEARVALEERMNRLLAQAGLAGTKWARRNRHRRVQRDFFRRLKVAVPVGDPRRKRPDRWDACRRVGGVCYCDRPDCPHRGEEQRRVCYVCGTAGCAKGCDERRAFLYGVNVLEHWPEEGASVLEVKLLGDPVADPDPLGTARDLFNDVVLPGLKAAGFSEVYLKINGPRTLLLVVPRRCRSHLKTVLGFVRRACPGSETSARRVGCDELAVLVYSHWVSYADYIVDLQERGTPQALARHMAFDQDARRVRVSYSKQQDVFPWLTLATMRDQAKEAAERARGGLGARECKGCHADMAELQFERATADVTREIPPGALPWVPRQRAMEDAASLGYAERRRLDREEQTAQRRARRRAKTARADHPPPEAAAV